MLYVEISDVILFSSIQLNFHSNSQSTGSRNKSQPIHGFPRGLGLHLKLPKSLHGLYSYLPTSQLLIYAGILTAWSLQVWLSLRNLGQVDRVALELWKTLTVYILSPQLCCSCGWGNHAFYCCWPWGMWPGFPIQMSLLLLQLLGMEKIWDLSVLPALVLTWGHRSLMTSDL